MAADRLRVLVVDDEELARRGLRRDLAALGGIEVVGECADGFEAVQAAAEEKPDLVFLDIRMPRLDGFEVLSLLDPGIAVVFVTAHDDRAVQAFDANAVDYVMKPVDPERLARAVERARERLRRREPLPLAAIGAAARAPGEPLSRLLVRDGARVHVIPVDDIDSIEAQDDYIAVHVAGKTHLKQQTIGDLEAALDPRRFVRIHRSWILNLDRLDRIELYAKDSRVAILKDGRRLPLSRAGHQRLRELL
ncbi:MAG TPA: LytTR family DNA-binding domain-containing protein [Candidatus Polarisedimenticolia bacterium]|nr:LytTR family DNA-binding domain-containing protein [Candidatus Polarisedimenticolia bacterium]